MRANVSSIFSGTLSIGVLLRGTVGGGGIDFAPVRISRGGGIHVLYGTQGELAKINRRGETLGSVVTPFPTPIVDGLIIDQVWIGIWLDREFRQARMAALPMGKEWEGGSSREDLRGTLNSLDGSSVLPSNSLWLRVFATA